MPPVLRAIVYALLDKNPETRPDATKLLNIPEVKEASNRLYNQIKEFDPELAQRIFEEPKKFNWKDYDLNADQSNQDFIILF